MPSAHGVVVERQAPVDLLQAAGLVGVANLAALGVAVELSVRARDLDPALVLLEGAKREVEDANRKGWGDQQLEPVLARSARPAVRSTGFPTSPE